MNTYNFPKNDAEKRKIFNFGLCQKKNNIALMIRRKGVWISVAKTCYNFNLLCFDCLFFSYYSCFNVLMWVKFAKLSHVSIGKSVSLFLPLFLYYHGSKRFAASLWGRKTIIIIGLRRQFPWKCPVGSSTSANSQFVLGSLLNRPLGW